LPALAWTPLPAGPISISGCSTIISGTKERVEAAANGVKRIQQRQVRGQISAEWDPRHVALTMRSLTWFPVAFPQLTRLITGQSVFDPKFQKERSEFLKKFAAAFRPFGNGSAAPPV
jgi:hypothetical protein